jgi:GTP cyclohydrolase I
MLTSQDISKYILSKMTKKDVKIAKANIKKIEPYKTNGNHVLTEEERAIIMEDIKQDFINIFKKMMFDLNDPNFLDTPNRVASMWVNELMVGRYMKKPRIEKFPVEQSKKAKLIDINEDAIFMNGMIVKKIDIRSLCSHHLMPFFTEGENSYALVAYIPTTHYLGISKIQRLANWLGAAPQLQEQLTQSIFDEITDVLGTDNVYVLLKNLTHTCETLRGVKSECGSTTTQIYGGVFEDINKRTEASNLVK